MLQIVKSAPPETKPAGPPAPPCPHGYVMAGNCVRCTPPPAYAPMRGPLNTAR